MRITEVYFNKNSVYIFCKVKDLRKLLAEYSKEFVTVRDLINAKLN